MWNSAEEHGEQEPKKGAVNKENDTWQVVNDGLFFVFCVFCGFFFFFFKGRRLTIPALKEENWGPGIQELQ